MKFKSDDHIGIYAIEIQTMYSYFQVTELPAWAEALQSYPRFYWTIAIALYQNQGYLIESLLREGEENRVVDLEKHLFILTRLFLDFGKFTANQTSRYREVNWSFILDHPDIMRLFCSDRRINLEMHIYPLLEALTSHPKKGRKIFFSHFKYKYSSAINKVFIEGMQGENKAFIKALWSDADLQMTLNKYLVLDNAIRNGQTAMVELLLSDAAFKKMLHSHPIPLNQAAKTGELEIVKLLSLSENPRHYEQAFLDALKAQKNAVVAFFVTRFPAILDIDHCNSAFIKVMKNNSATLNIVFVASIKAGNHRLVQALWADSFLQARLNRHLVIESAAQYGQKEMLELFLSNPAFKKILDYWNIPLNEAAKAGYLALVKRLSTSDNPVYYKQAFFNALAAREKTIVTFLATRSPAIIDKETYTAAFKKALKTEDESGKTLLLMHAQGRLNLAQQAEPEPEFGDDYAYACTLF